MTSRAAGALLGLSLLATPAAAEVLRFEPSGPPLPVFEGRGFGNTGAYERIAARVTIALDPEEARNAGIVDLALAPRNAQGQVEAVAEAVILRPADPFRGNGTLLVEVPNRGRELAGQLYHDAAANDLMLGRNPGNGFLLRQGYTLVWVGWQSDIPPGEGRGAGIRMEAPVVPGITAPSREEFLFENRTSPVTATLTYPAARREGATLTVRARTEDARQTPPGLSFRFLDDRRIEITRPEGFDAAALYEFIYEAKDSTVQGMAFAAFRDIASFLRWEKGPENPLARDGRVSVDRAILHGVSQSGRVVRDFLHGGFNEDEAGRRVYDAMLPHIPGTRRSYTNARFAQPSRNPTPHGDRHYPVDQFPFTYAETEDHLSGRRDGLLRRCRTSGTCPVIMQTDSEYEFWGARASLLVTDTRGRHLDLPPEVRAYALTGHPHFALASAAMIRNERCALPVNPLQAGAPLRALLVAAERWMREGVEPPASRFPMRAHGTLAAPEGLYAAIPGLPYTGSHAPAQLVDNTVMPPAVRGEYAVLLPRPDADGNALGGIRVPAIEAPRATYLGWNPRAEGFGAGALCTNTGGVMPFVATRAEREAQDDPGPSLEERYPTPDSYVAAVRAAAERLVAERLLLPEDAEAMADAATAGTLDRLRR
ncbi:alpha/beta hydrolase domain-containing protein [Sabulicella glaciei]|uniref:Alpha/beta hydrolase domain-containing protein n=1 Tax=Sabulicella glaciei TaxID=2984948 RepID=A0ABT3NXA3_9PROT|nr:alpha/beta hydrolase domain-containing protein [Roseococcus sp. MDT2-1-1]MCW8086779.1 alpha/beta hydrolase domain-containing protein [Roseococcus sp. MDT2-1-1]